MSIVCCDTCNRQIDTDLDVGCLIEEYDEMMCRSCRDNRDEAAYERQQQRLMDGDHLERKIKEDQELRDAGRGHLISDFNALVLP
jgi:hypothetical protein